MVKVRNFFLGGGKIRLAVSDAENCRGCLISAAVSGSIDKLFPRKRGQETFVLALRP